ncbi:MAG TPA: TraR/DksA C4-type zinc finger protein [Syntrophales bacterium]|jgi:DnaK suppressor protein|nr:TraR/DksA C4-type zinc finger protein [Syntrophaceae bacterium]MBP7034009.1 TraR/DksA C4-type zinc finger protein [Syntrophobacterales bacterium]MDI9556296.1 TraR/DksA C4-type zinc finger protein [Pseudomonadota bacterium]NLX32659.1 RNA polymerase-binding protein DksA [Deltaproteobacteria bacterium]HNU86412.1 TraR/DksA C4-type zinc finger protein [Syntrophales bacterium]
MATTKMKRYRTLLNHRIEEILKANGKPLFPSENLNGLLPDMYDLASFESERLYEYALKDRERKTVLELIEAVKRIEEGNYGICEDCLKPISDKRLQAAPAATLCIECKAETEKRERAEKMRQAHTTFGIQLGEPPGAK